MDAQPRRICLSAVWGGYSNSNTNRESFCYGNADSNGYCHCNGNRNANAEADAYAENTANTETSSHTSTSAVVGGSVIRACTTWRTKLPRGEVAPDLENLRVSLGKTFLL